MKIENQVCSLEQAKKLKKLGVKYDGNFFWLELGDNSLSVKSRKEITNIFEEELLNQEKERDEAYQNGKAFTYNTQTLKDWGEEALLNAIEDDQDDLVAAFTVAELGLMLPEYIESHRSTAIKGYWYCGSMENEDDSKCCDTQAEAMAAYLLYLISEEVIAVEEINQRLSAE